MAGFLMSRGEVDLVLVGADRIAANGDVANKIGTYTLAVLAQRHAVPFYVAAPRSTFDTSLADGRAIPVEERSPGEVTGYGAARWAPQGVMVRNPAFDITPAELVSALITECGILRPPFAPAIVEIFSN
jgi:methylthioribose-1-phosphate isomerase